MNDFFVVNWKYYLKKYLIVGKLLLTHYQLNSFICIVIISLLMSLLLGHRPSLWITHKENGPLPTRRTSHNRPRGPIAVWWVLTTANTAMTNVLTRLLKHGGARDNNFFVTHPMTDQCCLASAIVRRAHWPRGHRAPLRGSSRYLHITYNIFNRSDLRRNAWHSKVIFNVSFHFIISVVINLHLATKINTSIIDKSTFTHSLLFLQYGVCLILKINYLKSELVGFPWKWPSCQ
jgi:hypothetical protein